LKDEAVLAMAAKEGRVLVTHDRKTIPSFFGEFIKSNPSSGVLIVPQRLPVADVVDDLILLWAITEAEEWTNSIRSLPL
jgi:hypothetical protein